MAEHSEEDRPLDRNYIRREDNIIVGASLIKGYLQIRSWASLYRLIELYGLPCIKRPNDAKWMTSMTAIDSWLFLASEADAINRPYLRGTNVRLDIAKEQIERRIAQLADRDGKGRLRDAGG